MICFSKAQAIAPLSCEIYDLATDQILLNQTVPLFPDKETQIKFEYLGLSCEVLDRPIKGDDRHLTLIIKNQEGLEDKISFPYSRTDLQNNPKPPYVISEIPGMGDTVFFYCH